MITGAHFIVYSMNSKKIAILAAFGLAAGDSKILSLRCLMKTLM